MPPCSPFPCRDSYLRKHGFSWTTHCFLVPVARTSSVAPALLRGVRGASAPGYVFGFWKNRFFIQKNGFCSSCGQQAAKPAGRGPHPRRALARHRVRLAAKRPPSCGWNSIRKTGAEKGKAGKDCSQPQQGRGRGVRVPPAGETSARGCPQDCQSSDLRSCSTSCAGSSQVIKALMRQAPAAPACRTADTFSGPMPPMAYTGMGLC